MKQNSVLFALGLLFFVLLSLCIMLQLPGKSSITTVIQKEPEVSTIFRYQCIDTMKVSRDKARLYLSHPDAKRVVASQVQTIASLGANCVAIGTPYDKEFLPYLSLWVNEARKADLAVWFRGNQSSWEGWFDYSKDQSLEKHTEATVTFIREHRDLFRDGDIFSSNVEPENGGPFAPVDSEEKTITMRNYLADEQKAVKQAFTSIGKDVITSWISMSGGVARSVIDDSTLASLDNTVTLDHYVKDTAGMTNYIETFHARNGARIVLGEFGAPIPDINGPMNEKKQAAFVDSLFRVLYAHKDAIDGINYWTLSESSTALLNDQQLPKPVVEVIKKYYIPAKVRVTVVDRAGIPLKNIPVLLDHKDMGRTTGSTGTTTLIVPQGKHRLTLIHPDGTLLVTDITAHGKEVILVDAQFIPENRLFLPLRNFLQNF